MRKNLVLIFLKLGRVDIKPRHKTSALMNSQIVGQVVLLKRVSLKAMRNPIKVFTSHSTYKTFGLQEEKVKCNGS